MSTSAQTKIALPRWTSHTKRLFWGVSAHFENENKTGVIPVIFQDRNLPAETFYIKWLNLGLSWKIIKIPTTAV